MGVLSILSGILIQSWVASCLISSQCSFLCSDGQTCLPSHQVCDGHYDCPGHQSGPGGEEEDMCGGEEHSREEEEEEDYNRVDTSLTKVSTHVCSETKATLVADPTDCSNFYHCGGLQPISQSCGPGLMFHPIKQNCDWQASVMQVRPECRDRVIFSFRHGPRSWDSRRTMRMLRYLGPRNRNRIQQKQKPEFRTQTRRFQVIQEPQVQAPQQPQIQALQQHVTVESHRFQQRPRVMMPPRFKVPDRPFTLIPEAPRPHVEPQIQTLQEAQVQTLQQHGTVESNRFKQRPRVMMPPRIKVPDRPITLIPEAPRPHVVRLKRPQIQELARVEELPQSVEAVEEENLSQIISDRIAGRIRERIPFILSNLQQEQPAKQTKTKQEPVERVTHTVTSTTSSQVSPAKPSHDYLQKTIIGLAATEEPHTSEDYIEEEEEEFLILPELAPILVQDTRQHKPVWTVTRERPRQQLARQGSGKGTRVLKKIRRKLFKGERSRLDERRRVLMVQDDSQLQQGDQYSTQQQDDSQLQVMEEHSRAQDDNQLQEVEQHSTAQDESQLQEMEHHSTAQVDNQLQNIEQDNMAQDGNQLQEDEQEVSTVKVDQDNGLEEGDQMNMDERRAITLKEAYDMAINKLGMERNPGNMLLEMMRDDFGSRHYIDSSELRN